MNNTEKTPPKMIRSRPGKLEKRKARVGYLFVLPWLIGIVTFVLVPLCQSFYYMWYNIRITPNGMKFNFIGTGNFTQIWLEDPEFVQELTNYVWHMIVQVPIIVVFALLIALMLNQKIFARGFFRLIFFLPVIVVSGPVMNLLVSEGASSIPALNIEAVMNALSTFLPLSIAEGIADIFSNMIMILWYSGVQILIFLSALQKVDPSLYEAARLDGGSDWECFWKITLPTIKPMILLCAVYTVIFLSGNEQNELITIIKSAMFSGTKEKGYGYASAMAWMYAIIILLIVLLFFILLSNRKGAYDKRVKQELKAEIKEARMMKRVKRRTARNAAKRQRGKA